MAKTFRKVISVSIIVLLLAGCGTRGQLPAEGGYSVYEIVPRQILPVIEEKDSDYAGLVRNFAAQMEKVIVNPDGIDTNVALRLIRYYKNIGDATELVNNAWYVKLKDGMRPHDHLVYFNFAKDYGAIRYEDEGLLVERKNEVIFRHPFARRTTKYTERAFPTAIEGHEAEIDENLYEFDRL